MSPRRRRRPMPRMLRNALLFLLGVAIAGAICMTPVLRPGRVATDSMEPTLRRGDCVLTATTAYARTGLPARGHVVTLAMPGPEGERATVRRVVGLPGDTVEVRQGRLLRNGKEADEPRRLERFSRDWPPLRCPEGWVLVAADNRLDTELSAPRQVPVEAIWGRTVYVCFPPMRMGFVR